MRKYPENCPYVSDFPFPGILSDRAVFWFHQNWCVRVVTEQERLQCTVTTEYLTYLNIISHLALSTHNATLESIRVCVCVSRWLFSLRVRPTMNQGCVALSLSSHSLCVSLCPGIYFLVVTWHSCYCESSVVCVSFARYSAMFPVFTSRRFILIRLVLCMTSYAGHVTSHAGH